MKAKVKDSVEVVVVSSGAIQDSALVERIKSHVNTFNKGFSDLCFDLLEAQQKGLHTTFGYSSFPAWIDSLSIGIGGRQAYYYVAVASTAKELGISRETVASVGVSKLKEIFSLDKSKQKDDILNLVGAAHNTKLSDIKDKIQALKGKDGAEQLHFLTLKVPTSVKQILDYTVEIARGATGDSTLSLSQCLEVICAEFLSSCGETYLPGDMQKPKLLSDIPKVEPIQEEN